jgi:hypothetical protein
MEEASFDQFGSRSFAHTQRSLCGVVEAHTRADTLVNPEAIQSAGLA